MEFLATVAFSLGVVAYSIASTLFFLEIYQAKPVASSGAGGALHRERRSRGSGFGFLCIAACFHLLHWIFASWHLQASPLESIHFALSAASWVAVVTFLFVGRKRQLDALGLFVGPFALAFLIASQVVGVTRPAPGLSRVLLSLHVTANLLGLGFVFLAAGAATLYLYVERSLKRKRKGVLRGRLPSLDTLDFFGYRLLLIGFPLLSFGVVTGGMFFSELGVTSHISLLRAVLGYATWIVVLAVLLLRVLSGWRGRKAAYGVLTGGLFLGLLLVVYLVRPLWGGTL